MPKLTALLIICILIYTKTKTEWKSKVIYQLLTDRFYRTDGSTAACANLGKYCGGTFAGLKKKLDYIKGMGFDSIWISPIPENQGEDYHGYAFMDLYKINSHFGTETELKEMINYCHNQSIWVMVDVVANHVAYIGEEYTKITPFNLSEHYHSYCEITNWWSNMYEMIHCRIFGLPDLDQDNPYVRSTLKSWVSHIIRDYSIDGLRIDTIPYVDNTFWKEFATAAGAFQVGEVFTGDTSIVASYQGPIDSVLNYPLYYTLIDVFKSGQSMYNIRSKLAEIGSKFPDKSILGNFLDNHDNPRWLNGNSNINLLKNALAFLLFHEGIPIVYYGTEQGFKGGNDPNNREVLWTSMNTNSDLYKFIQTALKYRKKFSIWNEAEAERYVDEPFYSFTRGKVLIMCTNNANATKSYTIGYHPYIEGTVLYNIFDTNDTVTVKSTGIPVTISGKPKIYVTSLTIELEDED